jgi:protein involved in polysaccharide export with SLBB domain
MSELQITWFLLIGVLLAGYAILDGFDLGVGFWHLFARKDEERRIFLRAIGPVWDGNEVWLLTGGGALFAAFPIAYASVFSAFYLPFMVLLAALIFRATAIEFRSNQPGRFWRGTWDALFSGASFLAVLLMVGAPLSSSAQDRGGGVVPPAPDLSQYQVRVGDEVEVVVDKHEEYSRQFVVPAGGQVAMPPIGRIQMVGKTVFQLGDEVASRLRADGAVLSPVVHCIVTKYSPRIVYVIGAARGTVTLPVHENIRVLELLALTGALDADGADYSKVRVLRRRPNGAQYPIAVSIKDILERSDERQNIVIREGDVIEIPRLESQSPDAADWVYILGKVRSPGRYPVVKGTTGFTLSKLIAMAGDFSEFGKRTEIVLIRRSPTGTRRDVIDFDEIIEGNRPPVHLMADDLVWVPESFF